MRRENRKKIVGCLAALLVIASMQPEPLLAKGPALPKPLEEQRKQIEQGQQAVQVMQAQRLELEQKVQAANIEQERLEAEIMTVMEKIQSLQQEVSELEEQVGEQNTRLKNRLRLIYERGDVLLLEVLLDAVDFSDFVDRYQTLMLFVEKDKQLIAQLEKNHANLQQVRAALEAEQEKRQNKQRDLLFVEEQLQQQISTLSAQITVKQHQVNEAQKLFLKRLEVNEAEKLAIVAFADYRKRPQFKKYIKGYGQNGTYVWPVPTAYTISSGYGMRGQEFHNGIDIAAPLGTPIFAASDGVVLYAGAAAGFGHWVVLAHENGRLSVYGHMFEDGVLVKPGQVVKQGEVIAKVGNDGHSSGPHLHFALGTEVTAEGLLHHVNPLGYLQ